MWSGVQNCARANGWFDGWVSGWMDDTSTRENEYMGCWLGWWADKWMDIFLYRYQWQFTNLITPYQLHRLCEIGVMVFMGECRRLSRNLTYPRLEVLGIWQTEWRIHEIVGTPLISRLSRGLSYWTETEGGWISVVTRTCRCQPDSFSHRHWTSYVCEHEVSWAVGENSLCLKMQGKESQRYILHEVRKLSTSFINCFII